MTAKKFEELLNELGACSSAVEWAHGKTLTLFGKLVSAAIGCSGWLEKWPIRGAGRRGNRSFWRLASVLKRR